MPETLRSFRHAARRLARAPASSAAAVLTLALGIAVLTLAYRAAYPVLVRPLPLPAADRLLDVRETFRGEPRQVAPANFLDWRERARSFADLAAYDGSTVTVLLADGGVRTAAANVSGNFFRTLGVDAALGRTFDPTFRRGAEPVAVLGHDLWSTVLGADPDVVGRVLRVEDLSVRVVGVLPADFRFAPEPAELWIRAPDEAPGIRGAEIDIASLRDAWYFRVVGRLAPGATLEAAAAEMDALAARLRAEHPATNVDAGARVRPLAELVVENGGSALRLLLGAALLVLLVAAANVTHLLLARSSASAGERSVKRALGARPGRLAGDAGAEALLLVATGGALGWAAAALLPAAAVRLVPGALAGGPATAPPLGGLPFALGAVAGVALLVAGIPAALAAGAPGPGPAGARSVGGGARHARLRWAIVAGEAALALGLVTGAGLLLRSLDGVAGVDPGFRTEGLWTLRVALPDARSRPFEERVLGLEALAASLARLDGVGSAAVGQDPTGLGPRASLRVEGRAVEPGDEPDVAWQPVQPGFLPLLGVALRRGRALESTDRADAPDVALVNEALVRAVFPGQDPLGRRVTIGLDGHDRPLTIVGVVADTRNRGPAEPSFPVLYRPLAQARRYGAEDVFVALRTVSAPAATTDRASRAERPPAAELRQAVGAALPAAAVHAERSGAELVARGSADARRMLGLLSAFGAATLLLGAVGIYGVASHVVGERRAEIALRRALGAPPTSIAGLVLGQGLAAAAVGLVAGLPLAWMIGRGLDHLLVGVDAHDPLAVGGAALLLLAGTALALVPATRRALATDPAGTLRE